MTEGRKRRSKYDELELLEVPLSDHPNPRPRSFDFAINGRRLPLGREPSELPSGRVPLYVCGHCGDLGCGALAVVVTFVDECVVWSKLGFETNSADVPSGELESDFPDLRDFWFLREEYEAALRP